MKRHSAFYFGSILSFFASNVVVVAQQQPSDFDGSSPDNKCNDCGNGLRNCHSGNRTCLQPAAIVLVAFGILVCLSTICCASIVIAESAHIPRFLEEDDATVATKYDDDDDKDLSVTQEADEEEASIVVEMSP